MANMTTLRNPTAPCLPKLHTFTCGCVYISAPCKCHPPPPNIPRFPVPNASLKHTTFPHRCRSCMLNILERKVDEEQEWRNYLFCEYGEACAGHAEMVAAEKQLAKVKEHRDRLASSIRGTIMDYEGLWTRVEEFGDGWRPVTS